MLTGGSVCTGLGAEGLHQCERLCAAVWEVAAGQPHLSGGDLHWSCTTAGKSHSPFLVLHKNWTQKHLSIISSWKRVTLPFMLLFFFHPQIFGICLAQNLVSDIEAVRASWWENDQYSDLSSVSHVSTSYPRFAPICFYCFHFAKHQLFARV